MRLKWNNIDASFEARSRYWDMLIGDGQYYSDYDQNVTLLNWLKNNGYKNGTTSSTRGYHLFDEEGLGSEAIVSKEGAIGWFNGGDNVFTADQVANLQKLSLGTPTMLSNMATMPNVTPRTNNMSQSVQVDVGGIILNGVNDPVEFKNQVCNILAKDTKAINIQKNNVYSDMMGGNSLSSRSLL